VRSHHFKKYLRRHAIAVIYNPRVQDKEGCLPKLPTAGKSAGKRQTLAPQTLGQAGLEDKGLRRCPGPLPALTNAVCNCNEGGSFPMNMQISLGLIYI
jgi:hypothetical protein